MVKRAEDRVEFLLDVLTTAIENFGYGWFEVDDYPDTERDADAYAIIRPKDEPDKTYRVDLDTVARGFGVIQRAQEKDVDGERCLVNDKTGGRLHMSRSQRGRLLKANRENDNADLDVVDALAVVECGLFGVVTYG